jgi:hypothetical protein
MTNYHLAQVNIARMAFPLDSAEMAEFVALLEPVNALADGAPGFVWRLQSEAGNATYLRPYDDDRILFNMSVWTSLDALVQYVYRSGHAGAMRRRREWFARMDSPSTAMWWVPESHLPTVVEAKRRLEYLERHGPTPFAFTFRQHFPPEAEAARPWDLGGLTPCPE